MRLDRRWDSNWHPRSVTIVEGTPKRETQPLRKACATASAVMEVSKDGFRPACETVHTCEEIGESS